MFIYFVTKKVPIHLNVLTTSLLIFVITIFQFMDYKSIELPTGIHIILQYM